MKWNYNYKSNKPMKFLVRANGKEWEVYGNPENDKMAEAFTIATNVYHCHGEVTLVDGETGQVLILVQHPL